MKIIIILYILILIINIIKSFDIGIDYFNSTGLVANDEGCFNCNITSDCLICSDLVSAEYYQNKLDIDKVEVLNIYFIQDSDKDNVEVSIKAGFGKFRNFCKINMIVTDKEFKKTTKRLTINGSTSTSLFVEKNQPLKSSICANGSFIVDGLDFNHWINYTAFSITTLETTYYTDYIQGKFNYTVVLNNLNFINCNYVLVSSGEKNWNPEAEIIINDCKFDVLVSPRDAYIPSDPIKLKFKRATITNCIFTRLKSSTFEMYTRSVIMDNLTISNSYYYSFIQSFLGAGIEVDSYYSLSNIKYHGNHQEYVFMFYVYDGASLKLDIDNMSFTNNTFSGQDIAYCDHYIFIDQQNKVKLPIKQNQLSVNNVTVKDNIKANQSFPLTFFTVMGVESNVKFNNINLDSSVNHLMFIKSSNVDIYNSNLNVSSSLEFPLSQSLNINYQNSTLSKDFKYGPPMCNSINGINSCPSTKKKRIILISVLVSVLGSSVLLLILVYSIRIYIKKVNQKAQDENISRNQNVDDDVVSTFMEIRDDVSANTVVTNLTRYNKPTDEIKEDNF